MSERVTNVCITASGYGDTVVEVNVTTPHPVRVALNAAAVATDSALKAVDTGAAARLDVQAARTRTEPS